MNRRELLKAHAAAVAALAAGVVLPASAQPVPGGIASLKIKWSKAPCRFCGTGCGVMVGVKDDRVVATHGDMLAEVGRRACATVAASGDRRATHAILASTGRCAR